jgi:ubiquinone/menaquinone biosynthesis C-methylase UbiE
MPPTPSPSNVEIHHADAEDLPVASNAIDIAMVNGIFNLNPDREAIFRELEGVLRQDGVVYTAELILREPWATGLPESLEPRKAAPFLRSFAMQDFARDAQCPN